MSSCFDPSFEDFLHDVFDINAASDKTGAADFDLDEMSGNNYDNGMQNWNGFFEEAHSPKSPPPYQRNDFQTADITAGEFDQGNCVGIQQNLGDSVVFSRREPAALDAGVAHEFQLGGPIGVSFFF